MTISWISPELTCTVGQAPTGGRIICELALRSPQHTSWRVRVTGFAVTFPSIVLYDAAGYVAYPRRGYRLNEQARDVVARLLPFLLADAESYRRTMGTARPADGWIFNAQVAEWAYLNDAELHNLTADLENPPAKQPNSIPLPIPGRAGDDLPRH